MNLMELFVKVGIDDQASKGVTSLSNKIGAGLKKAAKIGTVAVAAASAAFVAFGKKAVEVGANFDKSMSQVAATMGKTTDEIKELRDFALEMGSTTAFSASQAADALNYMALAGYDAKTSMEMLPTVLNLAAAGNIELAMASDMVTDAQSALGLSIEDTKYMVDEMAKASSKSNTSVQQLGEAFLTVGGTAKNMKYGTAELSTVLGLLADNGVKGAEGGTALRNILLALNPTSKKAITAFQQLGVSAYDQNGKMRELKDVFMDLNRAMDGMTDQDKQRVLSSIFNKVDLKSVNALLATSADRWDELYLSINASAGAAQKMAETQLDNLSGDVTLFKSALEGAQIALSDALTPSLRKFVQFGSEGLGRITVALKEKGVGGALKELGKLFNEGVSKLFSKLPKTLNKLLDKVGIKVDFSKIFKGLEKVIKGLQTNVFPALKKAFERMRPAIKVVTDIVGKFVNALGDILKNRRSVDIIIGFGTAIGAVVIALKAWKIAQAAVNAVMATNPILLAIGAVGALAVGISQLVGNTDKQTVSFSKNVKAAQEAAKQYREMKAASKELADGQIAQVDYVQNNLLPELEKLVDSNGKVKKGYEERAKFILGEFNNAMGTEYDDISKIIDANGKVKNSIYDVISAKKAQILLEAYEDDYREALKQTSNAEKARLELEGKVAKQMEKSAKAEKEYSDFLTEYSKKSAKAKTESEQRALAADAERLYNLNQNREREEKILNKIEKKYKESENVLLGYYADVSNYQTASTLVIQGKTTEAIGYLTDLQSGFKTAHEATKKELEQQVKDTEAQAKYMAEAYANGVKGVTQEMVDNAKKQAKRAKKEFEDIGKNMSKGIASGIIASASTVAISIKNVIDDAVKAAKKKAVIKSPSRLFRDQVGKYIGLGVAVGVDESTKDVVDSIKNQVTAIEDAYDVDEAFIGSVGTIQSRQSTVAESKKDSKAEVVISVDESANLMGFARALLPMLKIAEKEAFA